MNFRRARRTRGMGARVAHPEINVTMDDIPDLHRVLAAMREESPLVEVRCNGERAWIILTYEALRDALRDEDTFPSAASYSKTTDPAVGRTLNSMRGAEHHRNRAVVSPTFRKQRMESYREELLEPLCHEVVDRFEGERHVDLRTVLTHLLPMEAITRLLGLPSEDAEALERWSNALFTYPFDPQGALAAKAEFTTFLERVMEQRRAEPGDDLVSTLVDGEFQGRTLDDEEILSFLRLLFPAGTHNTTNAIGNLFFALLERPELMARVRDDVEARHWAVEEALRWEPSVGNLPRQACADGAVFHGVELPPDATDGVLVRRREPRSGDVRRPRSLRPRPQAPGDAHLRARGALLPGRVARAPGDARRARRDARAHAAPHARRRRGGASPRRVVARPARPFP